MSCCENRVRHTLSSTELCLPGWDTETEPVMAGKAPLIFPQDEGISCSLKTGDFFGGSCCPPHLVPPCLSPPKMHLMEWWKLGNSRIDWGNPGDSVWFCCFKTLIAPVSHVGSGVKLNFAISVNLIQA